VVFGRNEPDVHVCVGRNDPHVSRRHGTIRRELSQWVITNTGRLPIRFGGRLVLQGDRVDLPSTYTSLFIVGPKQEHLMETRVAVGARPGPASDTIAAADTRSREVWPLNPAERLVLVCLAQRYLRQEPVPQPLTWAQVANDLGQVRPDEHWTWRKAAHIVANVRNRLSAKVEGLSEKDVPPPVGNALNHNLIVELLESTTIRTADLHLLDG
jgi:hypothetical protein